MKQYYTSFRTPLTVVFTFLIYYLPLQSNAQCNCPPGQEPNTLVHTQVISTSLEVTNFKFPQFDASLGTLSCATVNAAITSVVRIRLENDEAFDLTYRLKYERSSTISGPGLNPTLVHSFGKNYGPFNLAASDGEIFSGPDFVQTPFDTVLRDVILTGTVSGNITEFLGTDSINYEYLITGRSIITGGGNYLGGPNTKDNINFQLIYTYCTPMLLGTNFKSFEVENKSGMALLKWSVTNEENNNSYEIEFSNDNKQFLRIGQVNSNLKKDGAVADYTFQHPIDGSSSKKLYYRVVRKMPDGSVSSSGIRVISVGSVFNDRFRVFPNPAQNQFTLDFNSGLNGQYEVEIYNVAGHRVHQQQFIAGSEKLLNIALERPLPDGMYIVRAKDANDKAIYSGRVFIRK